MEQIDSKQGGKSFVLLAIEQIQLSDFNARKFEANMTADRQAKFDNLVASVRDKGIIEPILVRPVGEHYQIIAGERRYRAAKVVAGESSYQIPCVVQDLSDEEAYDLMMIENLQREDLAPIEAAAAFKEFVEKHGNDGVLELSARTGLPTYTIRRQIRLLELPPNVLACLKDGAISQSHAELFTRVATDEDVSTLLDLCLRSKLTVKELADKINALSTDLSKAKFDTTECAACPNNTSLQCGLFASEEGKCTNSKCFTDKQREFFTINWPTSKAKEKYGTNNFHFYGESGQCEPLPDGIADRCRSCGEFVTLLRPTGAVVAKCERVCAGSRDCFSALYDQKTVEVPDTETVEEVAETPEETPVPEKDQQAPAVKPKKEKTVKPAAEPVNDHIRAEKQREAFFQETLPDRINASPSKFDVLRTAVLALVLASDKAKDLACQQFGIERFGQEKKLVAKILNTPDADLAGMLQQYSTEHLMKDVHVAHNTRWDLANYFGIDLAAEFTPSKDYLDKMTKQELVTLGEEPLTRFWKEPAVEDMKCKKHKQKALMSLAKGELLSLIVDSGLDLKGRTPQEILNRKEK